MDPRKFKNWLVVGPPLWKIWKSIGMIIMIIPNMWENKIDVPNHQPGLRSITHRGSRRVCSSDMESHVPRVWSGVESSKFSHLGHNFNTPLGDTRIRTFTTGVPCAPAQASRHLPFHVFFPALQLLSYSLTCHCSAKPGQKCPEHMETLVRWMDNRWYGCAKNLDLDCKQARHLVSDSIRVCMCLCYISCFLDFFGVNSFFETWIRTIMALL